MAPRLWSWILIGSAACRWGFDDVTATDAGVVVELDPTMVYRSVGPGRSGALAAGGANVLRLTGSVATFASALPDDVGVGDAVEYDSNEDAQVDQLAFIHRRISSTQFLVGSEASTPPADAAATQTWAIHRAYTSLGAAIAGTPNAAVALPFDGWTGGADLVARQKVWNVACYADAVDAPVEIMGWMTSPQYYLRIYTPADPSEVGAGQRHRGVWDPTKYQIEARTGATSTVIAASGMSLRLEGLQLFTNPIDLSRGLPYGVRIDNGGVTQISGNIIRGNRASGPPTIPRGMFLPSSGTTLIWNNIIYDVGDATAGFCVEIKITGHSVFSNNTLANCGTKGLVTTSGTTVVARNNLMLGCGVECASGPVAGSNNRTSDLTAANAGIGSRLASAIPADYFAAPGDFHIGATALRRAELIGAGVDLSADPELPFDDDVDGDRRRAGWDLGADEAP